jgi:hypothetical protein
VEQFGAFGSVQNAGPYKKQISVVQQLSAFADHCECRLCERFHHNGLILSSKGIGNYEVFWLDVHMGYTLPLVARAAYWGSLL